MFILCIFVNFNGWWQNMINISREGELKLMFCKLYKLVVKPYLTYEKNLSNKCIFWKLMNFKQIQSYKQQYSFHHCCIASSSLFFFHILKTKIPFFLHLSNAIVFCELRLLKILTKKISLSGLRYNITFLSDSSCKLVNLWGYLRSIFRKKSW